MFYNTDISKETGAAGEELVARYLKKCGYIIVKRNWRDRYGEVDIIAEDSRNIVFVEVKTRHKDALVSGLEAIDDGKKRRIRNAAVMFVRRMNTNLKPRIDVAEVTVCEAPDGEKKWKLKYIKSAF